MKRMLRKNVMASLWSNSTGADFEKDLAEYCKKIVSECTANKPYHDKYGESIDDVIETMLEHFIKVECDALKDRIETAFYDNGYYDDVMKRVSGDSE